QRNDDTAADSHATLRYKRLATRQKKTRLREGDALRDWEIENARGVCDAADQADSEARRSSSWPAEPRSWLRLAMNLAYSSMKIFPGGRKSNWPGLSRKN